MTDSFHLPLNPLHVKRSWLPFGYRHDWHKQQVLDTQGFLQLAEKILLFYQNLLALPTLNNLEGSSSPNIAEHDLFEAVLVLDKEPLLVKASTTHSIVSQGGNLQCNTALKAPSLLPSPLIKTKLYQLARAVPICLEQLSFTIVFFQPSRASAMLMLAPTQVGQITFSAHSSTHSSAQETTYELSAYYITNDSKFSEAYCHEEFIKLLKLFYE